MIDKNKMNDITEWLIENVFRNGNILYNDTIRYAFNARSTKQNIDLVDIIASLHNLLYECVNDERYDYMFHWANKVGSGCEDNIFDNMEDIE